MITDEYLHSYVDRRMKHLIAEWDLSRQSDISDMKGRIGKIEEEIPDIRDAEARAAARLAAIEARIIRIQEAMKR